MRSRPDGYTLLVDGVQTHAINPSVFSRMTYDTQRDLAPSGTPGPVVGTLRSSIVQALISPDVRRHFSSSGAGSMPALSPDETLSMLRPESERWGKVVRAANFKRN